MKTIWLPNIFALSSARILCLEAVHALVSVNLTLALNPKGVIHVETVKGQKSDLCKMGFHTCLHWYVLESYIWKQKCLVYVTQS